MLLSEIVSVSEAIASTRARSKKTAMLADLLLRLGPEEAEVAVSYLVGKPRQDRLGVGYATVYGIDATPALHPSLDILDVDSDLEKIANTTGPGSRKAIDRILDALSARATIDEQEFLRGLMLRNLRQGALEGVMAEAVARALGVEAERVRRAAMLEGDLVAVAARALSEGESALGASRLSMFTAVQPMLAGTGESVGQAVAAMGEAVVEMKLDGARVQVHRRGQEVKVFTRNLRDVSESLPEVVNSALAIEADSFILDGEALLVDETGAPRGFQDSISSFSTEATGGRPALSAFFFDLLHLDGRDLIDSPLRDRRQALMSLEGAEMVGSTVTSDPEVAEAFYAAAVAAGFGGVMVKDPSLAYQAGRRGAGWVKVKPTHTLDLVILAAEWGSGRRQGWLSNLHLGARGADGLIMLGKTFKGLTDEMLAWQTERFLQIEDRREGHIVFLRPEVVYEVAFDGVQRSTRYPGGVALRFARVKGFRDDKGPEDADTIETVRTYLK
jgi:DNA ligase-1